MLNFDYSPTVASTKVEGKTTEEDTTSVTSSTTASLDTTTLEIESTTASGNTDRMFTNAVMCIPFQLSFWKYRNDIALSLIPHEENRRSALQLF